MRQETALFHRRHDAGAVDLLDHERHGQHHGRSYFGERRNQHRRGGRAVEVIGRRSVREGIQHPYAHLIGVRQRQDGQENVLLVHVLCLPGLQDVGDEVPVAQHHALRGAGGAGGVDDASQVVGRRRGNRPVAGIGFLAYAGDGQVVSIENDAQLGQGIFRNLVEQAL